MNLNAELSVSHHRGRVWFGTTAISDVLVPEETAVRHAAAMCCRFASLRVTNEPMAVSDADLR
jgi:hypothetical protein